MRKTVLALLVFTSGLYAADLSAKWSKRLESTEAAYQSAVQKADNTRFYAIQKAAQERVKALKSALTEATKSGDFDAATELKARLAEAEAAGGLRAKPKNIVKFGGHEYALIEDKATWHVAKRLCEEMGGHLAIVETADEAAFILKLCGSETVWLGASDEATEGDWKWVNGTPVKLSLDLNNQDGYDHWLVVYQGTFADGTAGRRYVYACEWDN